MRRQQRAQSSRSVRERVHVPHLRVAGRLRKAKDTPSWRVIVWGCKMTDSGKTPPTIEFVYEDCGLGDHRPTPCYPCISARVPLGNESLLVFPFICWQHSSSPYDGLHPYVFMIVAIYYAWAILMIRGAKDPRANAALFDLGFSRTCCTPVRPRFPQALLYPDEIAHLWADVPALLVLSAACWYWHPELARTRTRSHCGGEVTQWGQTLPKLGLRATSVFHPLATKSLAFRHFGFGPR